MVPLDLWYTDVTNWEGVTIGNTWVSIRLIVHLTLNLRSIFLINSNVHAGYSLSLNTCNYCLHLWFFEVQQSRQICKTHTLLMQSYLSWGEEPISCGVFYLWRMKWKSLFELQMVNFSQSNVVRKIIERDNYKLWADDGVCSPSILDAKCPCIQDH